MEKQLKIGFFRYKIVRRRRVKRKATGTLAYKKHKEAARGLVHAQLAHYNEHYGLKWGRVSIKNTRSRWGSCSKKGNLNFSYKLALVPPELADYVVVHELCHLAEFNHGPNFWKLVAETIPDYERRREALKNMKL